MVAAMVCGTREAAPGRRELVSARPRARRPRHQAAAWPVLPAGSIVVPGIRPRPVPGTFTSTSDSGGSTPGWQTGLLALLVAAAVIVSVVVGERLCRSGGLGWGGRDARGSLRFHARACTHVTERAPTTQTTPWPVSAVFAIFHIRLRRERRRALASLTAYREAEAAALEVGRSARACLLPCRTRVPPVHPALLRRSPVPHTHPLPGPAVLAG